MLNRFDTHLLSMDLTYVQCMHLHAVKPQHIVQRGINR